MVAIDPFLITFVLVSFITLTMGIIFKFFKQPSVIVYILTGLIIGPSFLGLVTNTELVTHIGNLGIVLLLFFLGMEISIGRLIKNWKVAVIGTFLQIMISIIVIWIFGIFLDWSLAKIVLFGFIISLSSTAVLIKLLETKGLLNKKVGRDVISILLMQDLAIAPMIITLSFMGGTIKTNEIFLQAIGLLLIIGFLIFIFKEKNIRLPFKRNILQDHEFQLLVAFVICFGFAFITGFFQLSTALGAFLAGIFISNTKETEWVHESLHSFKILFVAIFFMSIGMLIQVDFIMENLLQISLLVFLVFLTNTFINALIFKWLGESWRYSLYSGAMLAQIGEFSFILASIGLLSNIIFESGYQTVISVISVSLLLSPLWIEIFSKITKVKFEETD